MHKVVADLWREEFLTNCNHACLGYNLLISKLQLWYEDMLFWPFWVGGEIQKQKKIEMRLVFKQNNLVL